MPSASFGLVIEMPMFSPRNAASFHEATTGVGATLHDSHVIGNGDAARSLGSNRAWTTRGTTCFCRGFHPASIFMQCFETRFLTASCKRRSLATAGHCLSISPSVGSILSLLFVLARCDSLVWILRPILCCVHDWVKDLLSFSSSTGACTGLHASRGSPCPVALLARCITYHSYPRPQGTRRR